MFKVTYIVSFFEGIGWKHILDEGHLIGFFHRENGEVILVDTKACVTSKSTLIGRTCITTVVDFEGLRSCPDQLVIDEHNKRACECFKMQEKKRA